LRDQLTPRVSLADNFIGVDGVNHVAAAIEKMPQFVSVKYIATPQSSPA
jgi:hypothetical protein